MNDPLAFVVAVAIVLATPGPTNTLLATAGATMRLRHCFALIPAEVNGYLVSVGLLLLVIRPIAESSHLVSLFLRVTSASYLAFLASRLWCAYPKSESGIVGFRQVFLTTLLNPKALVFAFIVFPEQRLWDHSLLRFFGLFVATITICCAGWLTIGAAIGRQSRRFITPQFLQRGAALVIGCFALTIFVSVLLEGIK
jgi:threonine/homoserine/homoserine lactone efflux protein